MDFEIEAKFIKILRASLNKMLYLYDSLILLKYVSGKRKPSIFIIILTHI